MASVTPLTEDEEGRGPLEEPESVAESDDAFRGPNLNGSLQSAGQWVKAAMPAKTSSIGAVKLSASIS